MKSNTYLLSPNKILALAAIASKSKQTQKSFETVETESDSFKVRHSTVTFSD